jgi:hypothetical protein
MAKRAYDDSQLQELLLQARDRFQGVYLMPSYNRHDMALDVLGVLTREPSKEADRG